jgi:hypothetical protein
MKRIKSQNFKESIKETFLQMKENIQNMNIINFVVFPIFCPNQTVKDVKM